MTGNAKTPTINAMHPPSQQFFFIVTFSAKKCCIETRAAINASHELSHCAHPGAQLQALPQEFLRMLE